jgi:hypothetical protein
MPRRLLTLALAGLLLALPLAGFARSFSPGPCCSPLSLPFIISSGDGPPWRIEMSN